MKGVTLTEIQLTVVILSTVLVQVWSGFCVKTYSRVSSSRRSTLVPRTCYYYTSCGFLGWQRCRRRRTCYAKDFQTYYFTTYYRRTECCEGYTGSTCEIPVCSNCRNNAVCTAPNQCYCRPGTSGQTCSLSDCSATRDCYPGTCVAGGSRCVCSSGFTGSDCTKIQEGGSIEECTFDLIEGGLSLLHGSCLKNDQGEVVQYISNASVVDSIEVTYVTAFKHSNDFPSFPTDRKYIISAPIGIIDTSVTATLHDSDGVLQRTQTTSCVSGDIINADNPHKSVLCSDVEVIWNGGMTHDTVLQIEISSRSGGYKEYQNLRNNDIIKKTYTGSTNTEQVKVMFDLERPKHCTEDLSCPEDTTVLPCAVVPDVSRDKETSVTWPGWSDRTSGIQHYSYMMYHVKMGQTDQLEEDSVYQQRTVVTNETTSLDLTLKSPGLYSFILEITDAAGNIARARSFFLFDDHTSSIEIMEEYPITVEGANLMGTTYWITSSHTTLRLSWQNRYINRFLHDHHLLRQIRSFDGDFDDTTGNRSVNAIPNAQGISLFMYALMADFIEVPDLNSIVPLTPDVQYYTDDITLENKQTMYLYLAAADIFQNMKVENLTLKTDFLLPVLGNKDTLFTQNTIPPDNMNILFASRLTVQVADLESGIHSITISVSDVTGKERLVYSDVQQGQVHNEYDSHEECVTSGECYCVEDMGCYSVGQDIWINHCKLLGLEGHSFRVDYNVMNGAGMAWDNPQTYTIHDMEDIDGLGWYAPPKNLMVIKYPDNVYKVNLTWEYGHACYDRLHIEVRYTTGSTSMKDHSLPPKQTSFIIDGLRPNTQHTAWVAISYYGGEKSEAISVGFETFGDGYDPEKSQDQSSDGDEENPETGNANTGNGGTIGSVIGVLVVVVIVCVALVLFWRWRKQKHLLPYIEGFSGRANPRTEDTFNNELNLRWPATEDSLHCYNNNAYSDKQVNLDRNLSFRVSYRPAEDDIYDDDDSTDKVNWQVSTDNIGLGEPLANVSGRFADFRLAKLYRNNEILTVVAKLNKAGASESDKALMTAKMNFLATAAPPHENIIQFIAAVPPPEGPMILLEYCEMGRLTDWLKDILKVSTDVEQQMQNICQQVASGMSHLHSQMIIHKRLGARNVLLKRSGTGDVTAKLIGFGPMEEEKDRTPVKWMAPEQFVPQDKGRVYNKHTDVWSYGVLVYEVYSKGEAPYQGMNNDAVKQQVAAGYRLDKPPNCSDFMHAEIMAKCFKTIPEERPDFARMVLSLERYTKGDWSCGDYIYDE